MEKLKFLVRSRKFWAAVVGLVVVILKAFRPDIQINEAQLADFVILIVAYILGTALEDSAKPALPAGPPDKERQ